MSDEQGNRRIAKNTLIVYVNMFINMLIGLFTSRLILQALGVSDYGLYSVVGGVVGLFTFVFGSLSTTTIRFINVERGKADGDLNKVFNVCNVVHIAMALIILIIAEIVGVYYINHFLNVETGKEADAMFIFQVSIIVSCIGVTNVPFSSLFNATEKFLFNAIVSIGLKVLQLVLVIWLLYYEGNRVRAWACISALSTAISFAVYHLYCYKYWPEIIKWRFVKEKALYKEAIVFNNYNLLSTAAIMGRNQGSSLLINFFFGTVVNGAFAVAKTVESYVMALAGNFDGASSPQITQSYSKGDMDRVVYLVCKIGKYCIFIMMLFFFPLIAEMDFVLHVWLKEVPEGALQFCNMTLIVAFISVTGGGIVQVINASGKISKFKTTFSIMMLSCLPIGYVMLKMGIEPYIMIGMFAVIDAIWRVVQLVFMKRLLGFPILTYVREVYRPSLIITIIVSAFIVLTALPGFTGNWWHLGRIVLVFLFSAACIFFIGLTVNERIKVKYILLKRLRRSA